MYFQPKPPSISAIRARFLIEKLRDFSNRGISISLCATGRTHSGKTTLGNRLVGIDYFMPSTGKQDCTDEVNLVEFPSGLKYFDLPGVCSDDTLENYNRAALGITQVDNFAEVEQLTLAKYSENQAVHKQNFTVSEFRQGQLNPDLIFYLIAPDKQFLAVDCLYLRDLLKHHSQVIYVFNIFADKETGRSIATTDQNITDVTQKIRKVHTSVFGPNNWPVIVPINCWTGEGIAELVSQAHKVLGGDKGGLFESLIQYQQNKTPNEYFRQVKHEILRLCAYVASQKPEGSHTCEQPIHQATYSLWNFLSPFQENREKETHQHFLEPIGKLIHQTLQASLDVASRDSVFEESSDSIVGGFSSIDAGIEYLNEEINSRLAQIKASALLSRNQDLDLMKAGIEAYEKKVAVLVEDIKQLAARKDSLEEEIASISNRIDACNQRRNSLVESFNSLGKRLAPRIEKFHARENELSSSSVNIDLYNDRYESRLARWRVRLNAYNTTVERINNSSAYVSQSTINSIREESDSLDREKSYIDSDLYTLKNMIRSHNQRVEEINDERTSIRAQLEEQNRIERQIDSEENAREEIRRTGIGKLKLLEEQKRLIQDKVRQAVEREKRKGEFIELCKEVISSFEKEMTAIDEVENRRIAEINVQIAAVRSFTSKYLTEKGELDIPADEIESFVKEISSCLINMGSFAEEINSFMKQIDSCATKMTINRLLIDLLLQATTYHFDSTGEYEYKGSTYNQFGKAGIALILTLTQLIVLGKDIKSEYDSLYRKISSSLDKMGSLSDNLPEIEVVKLLDGRGDSFFNVLFKESVKKLTL